MAKENARKSPGKAAVAAQDAFRILMASTGMSRRFSVEPHTKKARRGREHLNEKLQGPMGAPHGTRFCPCIVCGRQIAYHLLDAHVNECLDTCLSHEGPGAAREPQVLPACNEANSGLGEGYTASSRTRLDTTNANLAKSQTSVRLRCFAGQTGRGDLNGQSFVEDVEMLPSCWRYPGAVEDGGAERSAAWGPLVNGSDSISRTDALDSSATGSDWPPVNGRDSVHQSATLATLDLPVKGIDSISQPVCSLNTWLRPDPVASSQSSARKGSETQGLKAPEGVQVSTEGSVSFASRLLAPAGSQQTEEPGSASERDASTSCSQSGGDTWRSNGGARTGKPVLERDMAREDRCGGTANGPCLVERNSTASSTQGQTAPGQIVSGQVAFGQVASGQVAHEQDPPEKDLLAVSLPMRCGEEIVGDRASRSLANQAGNCAILVGRSGGPDLADHEANGAGNRAVLLGRGRDVHDAETGSPDLADQEANRARNQAVLFGRGYCAGIGSPCEADRESNQVGNRAILPGRDGKAQSPAFRAGAPTEEQRNCEDRNGAENQGGVQRENKGVNRGLNRGVGGNQGMDRGANQRVNQVGNQGGIGGVGLEGKGEVSTSAPQGVYGGFGANRAVNRAISTAQGIARQATSQTVPTSSSNLPGNRTANRAVNNLIPTATPLMRGDELSQPAGELPCPHPNPSPPSSSPLPEAARGELPESHLDSHLGSAFPSCPLPPLDPLAGASVQGIDSKFGPDAARSPPPLLKPGQHHPLCLSAGEVGRPRQLARSQPSSCPHRPGADGTSPRGEAFQARGRGRPRTGPGPPEAEVRQRFGTPSDAPPAPLDLLAAEPMAQARISWRGGVLTQETEGERRCTVSALQPGMVLLRNRLSIGLQQRLVATTQADLASSFRRPTTGGGRKYHVYSGCWASQWDGAKLRYVADPEGPPLPPWLVQLAQDLAAEAQRYTEVVPGGGRFEPDVGLVNYYPAKAGELGVTGIGGHQDLDDTCRMPVVSLSVGDSMTFFYRRLPPFVRRKSGVMVKVDEESARDSRDGDAAHNREYSIVLESGDVLIFGGASRLVYHGTRQLRPGTKPPKLKMAPGRLNFTFRQHDAKPSSQ